MQVPIAFAEDHYPLYPLGQSAASQTSRIVESNAHHSTDYQANNYFLPRWHRQAGHGAGRRRPKSPEDFQRIPFLESGVEHIRLPFSSAWPSRLATMHSTPFSTASIPIAKPKSCGMAPCSHFSPRLPSRWLPLRLFSWFRLQSRTNPCHCQHCWHCLPRRTTSQLCSISRLYKRPRLQCVSPYTYGMRLCTILYSTASLCELIRMAPRFTPLSKRQPT